MNSVPLVEGRPTYVRVKVDLDAPAPLISHQQLAKLDELRIAIAFVGNLANPTYIKAKVGAIRTFDYLFAVPSSYLKYFDETAESIKAGADIKSAKHAVKVWFPDTSHDLQGSPWPCIEADCAHYFYIATTGFFLKIDNRVSY